MKIRVGGLYRLRGGGIALIEKQISSSWPMKGRPISGGLQTLWEAVVMAGADSWAVDGSFSSNRGHFDLVSEVSSLEKTLYGIEG